MTLFVHEMHFEQHTHAVKEVILAVLMFSALRLHNQQHPCSPFLCIKHTGFREFTKDYINDIICMFS